MAEQDQQKGKNYEEIIKKSLLEIRSLKQKLAQAQAKEAEPLAIVSMACRFPGGVSTPEQFWQLLVEGKEPRSVVPKERWDIEAFYNGDRHSTGSIYTRYGYFLDDADKFDCDAFEISPREAITLDPQQRVLLEVATEVFLNADQSTDKLYGSNTGVFVGLMNEDYMQLSTAELQKIDVHTATGYTRSVAAGRISHHFGLRGAAQTIDTACSSSLVALHTAVSQLRSGEISQALVCGVNIMASPRTSVLECSAGMLSQDGRCKAFDQSADGYGRGEGCGGVLVKRLSDAITSGDKVLAVIKSCATNHDGKSSGLTAPNGRAQQEVIRSALSQAALAPAEISYIEAHGTGTSLGDPIEVAALAEVFAQRNEPLLIGSVKTNIGHLESAAGIASLIKMVLVLNKRQIPAQLHFQNPNQHINWGEIPVQVVDRLVSIDNGDVPLRVGVSAFGLSGTNAHAILESAPAELPGYSASDFQTTNFKRERYWIDHVSFSSSSQSQRSSQADGEIYGSKLALPFSNETRYQRTISLREEPSLAGHALFGQVVLPAAYFIGLILGRSSKVGSGVTIEQLNFQTPLNLSAGSESVMQLIIDERSGEFKIVSRETNRDDGGWSLHVQGHVTANVTTSEEEVEAPKSEFASVDREVFYEALSRRGYDLEENFRRLSNLERSATTARAQIDASRQSSFYIATEVIDSALHLLLLASGTVDESVSDSLFVPVRMSRVVYRKPISSSKLSCYVVYDERSDSALIKGDIFLRDEFGDLILTIHGFEAARVTAAWVRESLLRQISADLYRADFKPKELRRPSTEINPAGLSWLVIGADSELSKSIKEVSAGGELHFAPAFEPDRETLSKYQKRLAELLKARRYFSIIFSCIGSQSDNSLSIVQNVTPLLSYLQQSGAGGAKILLISKTALAIDTSIAGEQGILPGMLRVFRSESPEIDLVQIDIAEGIQTGAADFVELLRKVLSDDSGEVEYLIRSEENKLNVSIPRLAKYSPSESLTTAKQSIHGNNFIVTGGLGSLGIKTARWLAKRGAGKLFLLTRSELGRRGSELVDELAKSGTTVYLRKCDLLNFNQLKEFSAELANDKIKIDGVIHSAGLLDDARITDLTPERYLAVVESKVTSLKNLLAVLPADKSRLVIAYSSAAGVLGNSGQANYGGANTLLDSYVEQLRHQGVSAFSVQWGPWKDGGMAGDAKLSERFIAQGILPLEEDQGFLALESIIAEDLIQCLVLNIDWQKYFLNRKVIPLAADLVSAVKSSSVFIDKLQSVDQVQRHAMLTDFVASQVSAVLLRKELTSEQRQQPFFELGMDSMIAVELRNVLQRELACELTATVALEHASVVDLTKYLIEQKLKSIFQENGSLEAEITVEHKTTERSVTVLAELEALEELLRQ